MRGEGVVQLKWKVEKRDSFLVFILLIHPVETWKGLKHVKWEEIVSEKRNSISVSIEIVCICTEKNMFVEVLGLMKEWLGQICF